MQGIALRKLYLFYPTGDNLPCLFGLYAGSGRALHALAALSVIAWYDGVFPADVDALADLFQRGASHEAFHQFFLAQRTCLQFHHGFLVQQSVQRGQGGEYLRIAEVFYRLSFLVQTFQVDVVAVDAFVEEPDGYAAVGGKQGHAYVVAAETQRTGGCLVVLDGEYGYLRFPVGGDEADLWRVFHNVPRTVGQAVQYGRVGTHKLRFDRVLLEHQVVAFQVDVSIRITPCQVFLYLIHILYQVVRRGEVYNQFAVRQGRIGDAAHQVVASRRAADRGGDVGNLLACFQVGFYLP